MSITQAFYNKLASQYDKLFLDWQATIHEQAAILDNIFRRNGFACTANILDCACGIGTQAIGLATLGYHVTASDISQGELAEAEKRAVDKGVTIRLERADFRSLSEVFTEAFDIVIAMDNALPHMLSKEDLDAILANPWIDGVVVGPCDLAGQYGSLTDVMAPDRLEMIRDIAARAKAAGKRAGLSFGGDSKEILDTWFSLGIDMLSSAGDTQWLVDGAKRTLQAMRTAAE